MRKVLLSAVAIVTALTLVAAPASAQPRHIGHGFGLAALAIGVIGAAVGAEIVSHERSEPECRTRTSDYYDDYGNFRGEKRATVCRD